MEAPPASATLLALPPEVILDVCRHLTTPSFTHLTSICRKLFRLVGTSRDVLLQHLNNVPGIKLGLEDQSLTTYDLWLLFRQRAFAHLYGANFTADCHTQTFRSGDLNPSGSCLDSTFGAIESSFVFRDNLEIHHYNSYGLRIALTPSPFASGLGKVIQVVRHGEFISVLYASQQLNSSHSSSSRSSSPSKLPLPLPSRATRVPGKIEESYKRSRSHSDEQFKTRYRLVHFDRHNFDRPVCFSIKPPERGIHGAVPILTPVHLAVYNRLKCAFVWSESHIGLRKRNTTVVTLYVCDRIPPPFEEGTYSGYTIFPSRPPPPSPEDENEPDPYLDARQKWEKDKKYYAQARPVATRFRLDGTRLLLYAAGSIVPFADATIDAASPNTLANATLTSQHKFVINDKGYFRMDSAFYCQHNFSTDPNDQLDRPCTHVYLHLAVMQARKSDAYVNHENDIDVENPLVALCIVQTRFPMPVEECSHHVELDNGPMPPSRLTGREDRIVARLWGWSPPLVSTMSALDIVAVSNCGTRVAISYWHKIFVWPLQPDVLCEEWDEGETETDSDASSDAGGNDGEGEGESDHADSDAGSAAEANGHDQAAASDAQSVAYSHSSASKPRKGMIRATRYYPITKDKRLGDIIELKPIVLNMPNGAVARKMTWKTPSTAYDSDSDSDTDSDTDSIVVSNHAIRRGSSCMESSEVADTWTKCLDHIQSTQPPDRVRDHICAYAKLESDEARIEYIQLIKPDGGTDQEESGLTANEQVEQSDGDLKRRYEGSITGEERKHKWPRDGSEFCQKTSSEQSPKLRSEQSGTVLATAKAKIDAPPPTPSQDWGKNKTMIATIDEVEELDSKEAPDLSEIDIDIESGSRKSNKASDDANSCQDVMTATQPCSTLPKPATSVSESHEQGSEAKNIGSDDGAVPTDQARIVDLDDDSAHTTLSPLERQHLRALKGKAPIRDPPYLPGVGPGNIVQFTDSDVEDLDKQQHAKPPNAEPRMRRRRKKKRVSEDELVVLTDQGMQVWNMGVWAKGRREKSWLQGFRDYGDEEEA